MARSGRQDPVISSQAVSLLVAGLRGTDGLAV